MTSSGMILNAQSVLDLREAMGVTATDEERHWLMVGWIMDVAEVLRRSLIEQPRDAMHLPVDALQNPNDLNTILQAMFDASARPTEVGGIDLSVGDMTLPDGIQHVPTATDSEDRLLGYRFDVDWNAVSSHNTPDH
jgi:hypothetical protein